MFNRESQHNSVVLKIVWQKDYYDVVLPSNLSVFLIY